MTKLFLFLLFSSPMLCLEWQFSWERVDVNFNGVINSKEVIICYGTGSMILKSFDLGKTWEQENVFDDSLNIEEMVFSNDNFICILNTDFVVTGDKFGKNWRSIYTGIDNQKSIAVNKDTIFILSDSEINIYDNNFNFLKSITIQDTNNYYEISFFKDKLLVGGANGVLAILDINNEFIENIIDFKQIGWCISNCPRVRNIITESDKVYLSFANDVYESINLKDWRLKAESVNLFDIKNDTLFDLRTYGTLSMPSSLLELWRTDSLKNFKISKDWLQRNVDILAFTDFKFFDENVAFAVGRDKLIAKSEDGGINWELISNFKPGGIRKLNDSVFHSVQPKAKIYTTKNGGITWLPPVFDNISMLKFIYISSSTFYEDGFGYVFKRSEYDDEDNLLVTYDYGNSYQIKKNTLLNIYLGTQNCSFIRTKSGFNVIFQSQTKNYFYTDILVLDTAFNYLNKFKTDSVHVYYPNKTDDNKYTSIIRDYHWPFNVYTDKNDSKNYCISESFDDCLTWENVLNLNMGDTLLRPIINIFNNKYLIGGLHWYKEPTSDTPNVNQLFMIDSKNGYRDRLFNDVKSSYDMVIPFNKNLIIGGWESLFVNEDFGRYPFTWERILLMNKDINNIFPISDRFWFMVRDIKKKIDNYYLVRIKTSTEVETQTEIKTYLYSYPPYPIPADNIVHANIFWDTRLDFDNADIGIYNYTGARIADRDAIVIEKTNNYSGKLSWNCTGYESGVYFIIIKHGDARRVIPVVVGE